VSDTLQVINTALLAAIALAVPLNTWLGQRNAAEQTAQHAETIQKVAEVHQAVTTEKGS
jgi:N-methylhydantoinase B/oxoprolinase/acetone carboxylase alpha subunit